MNTIYKKSNLIVVNLCRCACKLRKERQQTTQRGREREKETLINKIDIIATLE